MEVDAARKRISLSMKTEESSKQKDQSKKPREEKPKQDFKSNNSKQNFKPRNEPKDADGDLQEKLAKLKGMFK
jgi:uncharacterized protein